ncbi:MAG: redoxin domain-containing protein [Calditrichae bacterium]|nr:redoxin domain-containing protein [Calditrichia bacterium]
MFKLFIMILLSLNFVFAAGVGDPAPDFTLNKLGGGTFTLNAYKGKVVYIFWFGHSCPFCIQTNGPQSQSQIFEMYSEDELQCVGIDTWAGSNESNVGSFKSSTGIEYPLLIEGGSTASLYSATYDRSMVIDQDGIIRYYGGSHSPHDWSGIRSVIDGLLLTTGIKDGLKQPFTFNIENNYPNPFNPQTRIRFSVDKTQDIKLQIFNINGQLVKDVISGVFGAGEFEAVWDGRDVLNREVASGVYLAQLKGESTIKTHRLILLK